MSAERLILLTNDDGLWAPGLAMLAKVASSFGRVVTVAPDRNRSAISSALSLHTILRMHDLGGDRYTADGTPVDCVQLGIYQVLGQKPDWVLSGVNHGFNLGEDVFYSGTVGAAFEGMLQGAKAAAFSLAPDGDMDLIEPWIRRFLERWERLPAPSHRIWNLNFPAGEPRGFRITGQDNRRYHDTVEKRVDPRGTPYYWIGGNLGPTYSRTAGSDAEAALDGWISLTPLKLDLACPDILRAATDIEQALGDGA